MKALAANARFLVALTGMLFLAIGIAVKFDVASAGIVCGCLLLVDGFVESWSKKHVR